MPGQQITRKLTVTIQQPLRAGFSPKTNKPYTLYSVQTAAPVLDDGGQPCELRAFGLITHGEELECTLEVYASSNGARTWTVKPNDRSKMQRPHTNLPKVKPTSPLQAQQPTSVGTPSPGIPSPVTKLAQEVAELYRKNAALQAQVDDTYAQVAALNHKIDTLTNLFAPSA